MEFRPERWLNDEGGLRATSPRPALRGAAGAVPLGPQKLRPLAIGC
jgi:hypothetical protein